MVHFLGCFLVSYYFPAYHYSHFRHSPLLLVGSILIRNVTFFYLISFMRALYTVWCMCIIIRCLPARSLYSRFSSCSTRSRHQRSLCSSSSRLSLRSSGLWAASRRTQSHRRIARLRPPPLRFWPLFPRRRPAMMRSRPLLPPPLLPASPPLTRLQLGVRLPLNFFPMEMKLLFTIIKHFLTICNSNNVHTTYYFLCLTWTSPSSFHIILTIIFTRISSNYYFHHNVLP